MCGVLLASTASVPHKQVSKVSQTALERQSFWNSAYDNPDSFLLVIPF